MPIVVMESDFSRIPKNAPGLQGHCHVAKGEVSRETIGPCPYWTYHTYVGCCISESEANGSWDSDFYMLVWDEEKQAPERILFASTRGWSYPCLASHVDATQEVVEKYKAWGRRTQRHYKAQKLVAIRCEWRKLAQAAGMETYLPIKRLVTALSHDEWLAAKKLLSSNLRSEFRISLRKQVLAWLNDPAPKHKKPLSPKQWQYV